MIYLTLAFLQMMKGRKRVEQERDEIRTEIDVS